ncbi:hypothetical protein NL676_007955 [Syzygium grande]|nr:hypothetical protein NL676_007955 [Syzygium grande]
MNETRLVGRESPNLSARKMMNSGSATMASLSISQWWRCGKKRKKKKSGFGVFAHGSGYFYFFITTVTHKSNYRFEGSAWAVDYGGGGGGGREDSREEELLRQIGFEQSTGPQKRVDFAEEHCAETNEEEKIAEKNREKDPRTVFGCIRPETIISGVEMGLEARRRAFAEERTVPAPTTPSVRRVDHEQKHVIMGQIRPH